MTALMIGQGLYEPVSPWRSTLVFGADLNTPNAQSWNALPGVLTPTNVFDLSNLASGHEVVVAVLNIDTLLYTSDTIIFTWYRARDGKVLYTGNYSISSPASSGFSYWNWWYTYSYIGYTSWEISENGAYYVKAQRLSTGEEWRQDFTITGVTLPACPHASIVGVSAPSQAKAGDPITMTFQLLSNVSPEYLLGAVSVPNQTTQTTPQYAWVEKGQSASFSTSFTMNDAPVMAVTIAAYYWDGSQWVHVDNGDVVVTVDRIAPLSNGWLVAGAGYTASIGREATAAELDTLTAVYA